MSESSYIARYAAVVGTIALIISIVNLIILYLILTK